MMSKVLFSFVALMVLLDGLVISAQNKPRQFNGEITPLPLCGGPPSVTINSVTPNPPGVSCAVEADCVKVDWATPTLQGSTISNFIVHASIDPNGACPQQTRSVTVPGSARSATLEFAHCGDIRGGPFNVTVTANYSSCTNTSKTGAF
jgi:hypothetical protein